MSINLLTFMGPHRKRDYFKEQIQHLTGNTTEGKMQIHVEIPSYTCYPSVFINSVPLHSQMCPIWKISYKILYHIHKNRN